MTSFQIFFTSFERLVVSLSWFLLRLSLLHGSWGKEGNCCWRGGGIEGNEEKGGRGEKEEEEGPPLYPGQVERTEREREKGQEGLKRRVVVHSSSEVG